MAYQADQNFDDLAYRFNRNVYAGLKGKIRLAVLERDLSAWIPHWCEGGARVLDAGGGQGQFAVVMARLGHRVSLWDISERMLSYAEELAVNEGVAERIDLVQGAIQHMPPKGEYDLVTCHAVLEWVSNAEVLIGALVDQVKAGGFISLTFYNRESITFKNLLRANFAKVRQGQYRGYSGSLTPHNPLSLEQVQDWLSDYPLEVLCKSGIRVFHDYIVDPQVRNKDPEGLLEMELSLSQQEPYLSLARYVHLLLKSTSK